MHVSLQEVIIICLIFGIYGMPAFWAFKCKKKTKWWTLGILLIFWWILSPILIWVFAWILALWPQPKQEEPYSGPVQDTFD